MDLFYHDGEAVCPGDKLCSSRRYECGHGTHLSGNFIMSSLLGRLKVVEAGTAEGSKPFVTVVGVNNLGAGGAKQLVPCVGDRVLARVTQLNPRYASAEVMCVGNPPSPLSRSFAAIVRAQDVRATEIDKVSILASFRPGDVVRAEIISLGESRSLLLSTAKADLGVVHAKGPSGEPMVAVSWEEMQCPATGTKEKRKVAKSESGQ